MDLICFDVFYHFFNRFQTQWNASYLSSIMCITFHNITGNHMKLKASLDNGYPTDGYARVTKTAKFLGVSYPTLWRWMRDGDFVKPIELSEGVKVFDAAEVRAWVNSKKEAA